ncbi:MAG TPA: cytochrome C oxidase subunit IV family protein [Cyclobacteriaceae bacterium]|nr:cytochrome C oxidase subunit IV family protein [Cyclobacteriaceae bacterium]
MESTHHQVSTIQPQPVNKDKIRKLIRIAVILGIITSIEFFLALSMPRGVLLTSVFIMLTLVKAFYIVSEFMHLKYEVKVMIWSIILPMVLVVWLIIALITEGGSVFKAKFF